MLTIPPFTPSGPGFVNGLSNIDAGWLNYISQNFPRALDAVGGGYYQASTTDLRLSGDQRKIKITAPALAYPTELRGYLVLGQSDDINYATGVGGIDCEIPFVLKGTAARFRERDVVVASVGSSFLPLTADTYRIPALAGNVSYSLARSTPPAPIGSECIRVISRGNNAGKTITITSEGSQGDLCTIDGGVYVVAEFRFDATVSLGDTLGAWFLSSPVQSGLTTVSPYPLI
jgi:hypothetical protein